MEAFDFRIRVPVGIHVRNALLLCQKAAQYQSSVTITKGERTADAKKLMEIMILRVRCGDQIRIAAEGPDEKAALVEIKKFCDKNF